MTVTSTVLFWVPRLEDFVSVVRGSNKDCLYIALWQSSLTLCCLPDNGSSSINMDTVKFDLFILYTFLYFYY